MKKAILFALVLLSSGYLLGQDLKTVESNLKVSVPDTLNGWRKGAVVGVNVAQTSLTNWAAGGQSSFSLNALLSTFVKYNNKKNAWENTLDVGYGFLNQKEVKYTKKTDDKIDFMSKYGRKIAKKFYYSIMVNFKTQMTTGYKYPTDTTREKISDIFAPAYLISAMGIDYQPSESISIFAAPLTGRITFVNDTALSNAGSFGVSPGDKSKTEFGGYLKVVYSKGNFESKLLKNVAFTTKIDLFSNYIKNPQNIVVNWETMLALKVNEILTVNFNTQLIYDDKIKISKDTNGDGVADIEGPRVQFKEIFGVGLSLKF
ncbi:MAG: DUF3078 domain-containing protein [Bacteroidales bacterium]|nr:DUF3078 domain-containing protein [Bacteroidales bacterium]HPD94473.1 DUF3078 domain-containing protein [Tenuifilaceae bacterium]HRX31764.1 DUF3078 domain-containing protein [Tenuifilaceae bacterium]